MYFILTVNTFCFLFSISLFVFSGCSPRFAEGPSESPRALTIVLPSAPETLDWNACRSRACLEHAGLVMEGLTFTRIGNREMKLEPRLAQSWSRPTPLSLLFQIKNVTYSDATALSAKDFVVAWKKLLESQSPFREFLYCVTNAERFSQKAVPFEDVGLEANGQTLLVKMDKPCPLFLFAVSHPALFPTPPQISPWAIPPSLGPYLLEKKTDEVWSYAANPSYAGTPARTAHVQALIISQPEERLRRIGSGESHLIEEVEFRKTRTSPFFAESVAILTFPAHRLKSVREAFARSLDREELARLIALNAKPTTSLLPLFYDGDLPKPVVADAKLLKEWQKSEWTLTYKTANLIDIAENMKAQWSRQLGIEVSLLASKRNRPDQSLGIIRLVSSWPQSLDVFSELSQLSHSPKVTLTDPLSALRVAATPEDFRPLLEKANAFTTQEETWAIPLVTLARKDWVSPHLSGFEYTGFGSWSLRDATQEQ